MNTIDYALVEEKRPPMYTAMKYWGKKPHNIWGKYIETYTEENDIILDPFAGSAVAAFEAVKCGRKALAFDINPLTSFLIDVYSTEFEEEKFASSVRQIVEKVQKDEIVSYYYRTKCSCCGKETAWVQHFKWDSGVIYEYGVECEKCEKRYLREADDEQLKKSREMTGIVMKNWYPADKFYETPSISEAFIQKIGGDGYSDIWTRRNLYVLSEICKGIEEEQDETIKKQLLFGLIQSVHLCSKMCVPRRAEAKRGFSTSWGRSAYICSARQMEMNPLLVFYNNCLGKQSVKSALVNVKQHLGKVPQCFYLDKNHPPQLSILELSKKYDIIYGILDIRELPEMVPEESVRFIITDPPYGGLVQYMDLSNLWLIWLKHFDAKYTPDISKEITIKKGMIEIEEYSRRFTDGIRNLERVLAPGAKLVITFHNQEIAVWNAFLRSICQAGFQIEKVIHQQNRRTGESNVSNPYGTSASDFYIRCSKADYVAKEKTNKAEFERFIVDSAIKIIASRSEPTPYQILFNGLLAELSGAGFELEDFDDTIQQLLKRHVGDVFEIIQTNQVYGPLWWFRDKTLIRQDLLPLSQRVEKTVQTELKEKGKMKADDILAALFMQYPNELTPDVKKIDEYIKKYAHPSGGLWIYNGEERTYGDSEDQ
ncbi:MAG: hypothetical protein NC419_00830 [Muribaculaceae bacterium]|nr:hypothetical protein [Muribaculaceae bacterium]